MIRKNIGAPSCQTRVLTPAQFKAGYVVRMADGQIITGLAYRELYRDVHGNIVVEEPEPPAEEDGP